jgi:hypothetical protein
MAAGLAALFRRDRLIQINPALFACLVCRAAAFAGWMRGVQKIGDLAARDGSVGKSHAANCAAPFRRQIIAAERTLVFNPRHASDSRLTGENLKEDFIELIWTVVFP